MSDLPDDPDLLAGEFVLGTLDAAERDAVAARAAADPALAAAIAAWERRLAPLTLLADPVAPPASLWDRLATSAGIAAAPAAAATPQPGPITRAWRSVALWRFTTAAGFAAAAAMLALTLARPPAPPPPAPGAIAALVPQGSAAAAFAATVAPDGSLRIVALEPVTVASGKDLELWALPPGATAPVSLGVLPANGRAGPAAPTPATNRTQLLVSLEPRGGSPTGQPTGPVLYAGTLRAE
jgi:anti-sigma-K factor RskA